MEKIINKILLSDVIGLIAPFPEGNKHTWQAITFWTGFWLFMVMVLFLAAGSFAMLVSMS